MKRKVSSSSLLFLAAVLVRLAVPIASQGCPLPSVEEINSTLLSLLTSDVGLTSTTILHHHFPCLAVARLDRYSYVSIAVNYTKSNSGDTTFTAQFQLSCSGDTFVTDSSLGTIRQTPTTAVFTESRRDCWACAAATSFIMSDPTTYCLGELCKLSVAVLPLPLPSSHSVL